MKLQHQIIIGYILIISLIITLGIISYNTVINLNESSRWVSHTHKVIGEINHIQKLFIDMETGQRGFLVTGKNEYLEPYDQAILRYPVLIESLQNTVSDNPPQVKKLELIHGLIQGWVENVAKPEIEARKKLASSGIDTDKMLELVLKQDGKRILDEIRQISTMMEESFELNNHFAGALIIEKIMKAMVDQETGMRGFIITGKDEYLEPFNSGHKNVTRHFSELEQIIDNSPDKIEINQTISQIESLAQQWRNEVAIKIINQKNNHETDQDLKQKIIETLSNQKGKIYFDQLQVHFNFLIQEFKNDIDLYGQNLVSETQTSITQQETNIRGYAISGEENYLIQYNKELTNFDKVLLKLKVLNKKSFDPASMKNSYNQLKILTKDWFEKIATTLIDQRREVNENNISLKDISTMMSEGEGKIIMDSIRKQVDEFTDIERDLLVKREDSSSKTVDNSIIFFIAIVLISILIAVIITLYNIKSVTDQVGKDPGEIAAITNRVASGDLNVKFEGASTDYTGILGSIKTMVEALKENHRISTDDNWLKTGVARISEISIETDDTIEHLSQKYINEIPNYCKAQIASLSIVSSEDPNLLELTASFAYSKRKGINNQFKLGEGLIGQAALEKKQITASHLPEDYIEISSSLGATTPKHISITPIIYNNELIGVLEIGFINEVTDLQLDYLNQACSSIASVLRMQQNQKEIKNALAKSQQLSKDLQTQQEILRQSSEELAMSNEKLETKQIELVKQREEVEQAKREVEHKAHELTQSNKYKSEFLANMSHELRTPLNSLLLLSKDLHENKKGHLDEIEVEDAKVIYEGGQSLLTLINDIMDLSKVEAGMLSVHIHNVNLDILCKNIKKLFEPVAKDKNLELTINNNFPNNIIHSDSQRLEQIIKNFLSNALKFTESGTVSLSIHKPIAETQFQRLNLNHENSIAFSVQDTGIGIPKEKQDSIFESFQQGDGSITRKYGGTGLGLSISKELAILLEGEVHIESSPEKGSTFTLYLPVNHSDYHGSTETFKIDELPTEIREIKEATIDTFSSSSTSSNTSIGYIEDDRDILESDDSTILVIEDDKNFAQILKNHIHEHGHKCIVSGDGRNGIFSAIEFQPKSILLDITLPDIDGHTVLEQLKFNLKTRHIPVYVISAKESKIKSLSLGALDHITKPTSKDNLNQILKDLANYDENDLKEILIVEDDIDTQRGMERLLKTSNTNLSFLSTGKEACEKILNHSYDCVILDLGLPDMTGLQVLRILNEIDDIHLPPIIIHSGKDLSPKENEELTKLASSIVLKCSDSPERLLDDISLFLNNIPQSVDIEKLHDDAQILKGRKVLLADDDMRNTYSLSKKLNEIGLDVAMAKDGQGAIEQLNASSDMDIVLMDIMMPIMNGYEAMEKIRQMNQYKDIPIIALTAKAMPEDMQKCLDAGASDYLVKPLDFDKLVSMLKVWLFKAS